MVLSQAASSPPGSSHRSGGDVSCPQGFCYACSPISLCAGIHHPNGNEKRITFSEQAIVPMPGDDTHLWVHWDPTPVFPPNPALTIPPQVTEAGSSGSPLYNKDRRFVGQLHGGPSACGATGDSLSDYYGRFSSVEPDRALRPIGIAVALTGAMPYNTPPLREDQPRLRSADVAQG